ncbi:MAG TPA: phosphatidate cytidylyltransferase [Rhodospirillaceae bacterium]|nr:MAG: hypothetical protein A2018_04060 [Alphaproteobacteria bacterium GWF2_58_20]HAU28486.1 phosphatidate cytidylyltransferase [Rhodospirillaceae bacterium]
MIGLRIISALVMGTITIAAFWKGGDTLAGMLAIVAAIGVDEWVRLVEPECSRLERSIAATTMFVAILLPRLLGYPSGVGALFLLAALVAGIARLTGAVHPVRLAVGLIYVGLGAVALSFVRTVPGAGPYLVLYVLLVVWATDIGGYMVGKTLGGPKLAPLVSPRKTWSGALGGILMAVLAAGLLAYAYPSRQIFAMLGLAAFLSMASQLGDLMESAIKRRYNVKDSGAIIPGHGGILDRVDGLLFAAPIFALWQMSFGEMYPWW